MPKKTTNIQYYEAVGRRKGAVARIRLYMVTKGKNISAHGKQINAGEVMINKKPMSEFFTSPLDRKMSLQPLEITENKERFAITVTVHGGGTSGQKEAIVNALAKGLVLVDENYKLTLRQHGFMTRDSRIRERRKVGTGGKARKQKQSPKR